MGIARVKSGVFIAIRGVVLDAPLKEIRDSPLYGEGREGGEGASLCGTIRNSVFYLFFQGCYTKPVI